MNPYVWVLNLSFCLYLEFLPQSFLDKQMPNLNIESCLQFNKTGLHRLINILQGITVLNKNHLMHYLEHGSKSLFSHLIFLNEYCQSNLLQLGYVVYVWFVLVFRLNIVTGIPQSLWLCKMFSFDWILVKGWK